MLKPLDFTKNFNEEVAKAIDTTLSEILGEHVVEVLYYHLKDRYGVVLDEIPYRLPTVIRVLEEMFGVTGTKAIGVDVAKKLYSQLGIKFYAHLNYTFQDYIDEVQKILLNPK